MKRWLSAFLMLFLMFSLLPAQLGVSAAAVMETKDGFLDFEAEDADYDSAIFSVTAGALFSGRAGLSIPKEINETFDKDSQAHINLSFKADKTATYSIWVRNTSSSPSSAGWSVYVSKSGGNYNWTQLTGTTDAPAWTRLATISVSEGQIGNVRLRAKQAKDIVLDRFIITSDASYTPNDTALGITAGKSLRILAIGNSFSQDSVAHMYKIAQDCGAEDIIIGNLYVGGCTLQQHWDYASTNNPMYTYSKNTTGTFTNTPNQTLLTGLQDEEWDFISLQQQSSQSGVSSSYEPELTNLINYINQNKTNPDAKLAWNMTWAYPQNSTQDGFAQFGNNQMTMYNSIVNAVQENIVSNDNIDIIIPTGTAIQNVRSSYIGDTLNRDDLHLSMNLGRYIAGITWVKALTGWDLDNLVHVPNAVEVPERYLPVIVEAVENAIKTPFAVTQSSYTADTEPSAQYRKTTNGFLDIEAEDTVYDSDVLALASNKLYSGFGGLAVKAEHKPVPDITDPEHVNVNFTADRAGTYSIWMRHTGSRTNQDGQNLYLSLGGGKYNIVTLTAEPQEPKWVKLGSIDLGANDVGYVRIRARQMVSVVYDRFIITDDKNYVPNDEALGITNAVPNKTFKILSIGNSFSGDSVEHLYKVAQDFGAQDIMIGNLAIGGSSIQDHWTNASNNNESYGYYKNSIGVAKQVYNKSILHGLQDEDWDIIVLQQQSSNSGVSSTYNSDLTNLIEYIKKNKTNPNAKIAWHMTWAYPQNSTQGEFAQFNNDQMTMYQAIVNAVQENIVPNDDIDIIIPSGTAIQNVRSSYIGDTLNRDGLHLSWNLGRYIASVMWVKALTGWSTDSLSFVPDASEVPAKYLSVIKEAVENAYKTPFSVTVSSYAAEPDIVSTITGCTFNADSIKGSISATVSAQHEAQANYIIAIYKDNALSAVKVKPASLSVGDNTVIFDGLSLPKAENYTYKLFVWDNVFEHSLCKAAAGTIY